MTAARRPGRDWELTDPHYYTWAFLDNEDWSEAQVSGVAFTSAIISSSKSTARVPVLVFEFGNIAAASLLFDRLHARLEVVNDELLRLSVIDAVAALFVLLATDPKKIRALASNHGLTIPLRQPLLQFQKVRVEHPGRLVLADYRSHCEQIGGTVVAFAAAGVRQFPEYLTQWEEWEHFLLLRSPRFIALRDLADTDIDLLLINEHLP